MLEDNTYDAMIVDATVDDDDDALVHLDLALMTGPRRGDVVSVRARHLGRDALDLLGLPVTLVVVNGEPRVELDR